MVGDDNVLCVFVNFFICQIDELVSHSHSVEDSVTPDSDEYIGVFIGFLVEGK